MPTNLRPEISYLVQHILPILNSQYDYPAPDEYEHVKIQEIPIRIGGTVKKPDCVYYWEKNPVLLIEAKKEDKTEEDAQDQAFSYVKNYPVKDKKYSENGIRPRFIATTVGKDIKFYECKYELIGADFRSWLEPIDILDFKELLAKYGLSRGYKPKSLSSDEFREYFLLEMAKIYSPKGYITKDAIYKVATQILAYLENTKNYTSREPYISLDNYRYKQAQIRQLFSQYNILTSLTNENAKEFRKFVLRAFQGTQLNQYMTEQCVIDFMVGLIDIKPNWKVLDFECGSGGFLSAVVDKGKIPLANIRGIDIDPLPVAITKTYLAIHFEKIGKDIISLPVIEGDGLKDNSTGWDLVIGNPAGSDRKGASEYSLSIRCAINACKIGGKICLLLPEGFFTNLHDEILKKICFQTLQGACKH